MTYRTLQSNETTDYRGGYICAGGSITKFLACASRLSQLLPQFELHIVFKFSTLLCLTITYHLIFSKILMQTILLRCYGKGLLGNINGRGKNHILIKNYFNSIWKKCLSIFTLSSVCFMFRLSITHITSIKLLNFSDFYVLQLRQRSAIHIPVGCRTSD